MTEKIIALIANQLNLPLERVNENSLIVEDLGADSLDIVELLMTLEEEYGVTLSDEQASKIKTVNDIVKTISDLI